MESLDYASDTIKKADGSVLRFAGDAILAEFSSVVNAVETALGIQEELARRHAYEAEDERVRLRVGLNIGEVMEDEEALEWAKKTVQIGKSTGYWGPAMLAACHANLGYMDDATNYVAKALEAKPDLSLTFLHKTLPTKYEGGLSAYLEGLRAAGLPE